MSSKFIRLLIVCGLLSFAFVALAFAQKNTVKNKKKLKVDLISAGVVNGKAKNLVVPEFPPAARAVNIYGTVIVKIIIDEKGNVLDAKAISGHGLLRPNSVEAALQSKFVPFMLSGTPTKVSGFIIYNYIPNYSLNNYNWLEIGYSVKDANIWNNIPKGFENEKAFFENYINADNKHKKIAFDNLIASIEGKLSEDEKNLWLFRTGMFLNDIYSYKNYTQEIPERLSFKLDNLLLSPPRNVSPNFLSKLNNISTLLRSPEHNTYNPLRGSKLNEELNEIEIMMPIFGRYIKAFQN